MMNSVNNAPNPASPDTRSTNGRKPHANPIRCPSCGNWASSLVTGRCPACAPAVSRNELTIVLSMRITPEDKKLLDDVANLVRPIPRLTLARRALQIGLATLQENPALAIVQPAPPASLSGGSKKKKLTKKKAAKKTRRHA